MLHYLYLLGITVEAMTGALSAGRKKMDLVGVMIIAIVAALGGGTVRDILIGRYPLTWVEHPQYILLTAIAALITVFTAKWFRKLAKIFLILDAIGLCAFAVIGTEIGIQQELHPIIIALVACITGAAGGMLRDILCNDVPLVLRKELYAVVALGAGIMYMILSHYFEWDLLIQIITIIIALIVRLWAIFWHIELPKFHYD